MNPEPDPRAWHELDVHDWRDRITTGQGTAEEGILAALARISELDPSLNAFATVLGDSALATARALDTLPAAERGPLHGVPVAIKEENDVQGLVTTFGTSANTTPATADSHVVARLREAGAIIIGTTRMPEFGQWPFTESTSYGITKNPVDPTRTPGGSSGGTAAAVASGMVPVAIGGDGGGSIRIPAAHCGLVGLKPQRGRVSPAPYRHLWWSLGTTGPLTRTVRDSALVYDVVAGSQATDAFPTDPIEPLLPQLINPKPIRIGWSVKSTAPGIAPHPDHIAAVQRTAATLRGLGHTVVEYQPKYKDSTFAFVTQFFAGMRSEAQAVDSFGALEARTRSVYRLGSWVTDKVRGRAIAAGKKIATHSDEFFTDVDLLLTPTVADRPARAGILTGKGAVKTLLASRSSTAYTAYWNVTGHPAVAVPVGRGADGLPVSVQLVGPRASEGLLLSVANQLCDTID